MFYFLLTQTSVRYKIELSKERSVRMKDVIKKGLIIVGIYLLFIAYIMFACNRMEKLDNQSDTKNVAVSLNFGK